MGQSCLTGRILGGLFAAALLGGCASGASPTPAPAAPTPASQPSVAAATPTVTATPAPTPMATPAPTPASTRTPTAAPSASAPVPNVLARDVTYATAPTAEWKPPLLDVYAPPAAHGLPLVVLFHGGSSLTYLKTNKDSLDYPELAEAIASLGAVVIVPNWGSDMSPMDMLAAGSTPAQAMDFFRQEVDEGACAVSYAVAHAGEYGADPRRLVLAGHSAGANFASLVALGKPSAFSGCAVPVARWTAHGLMLWEGDWLGEDPSWDVFETSLPAALSTFTPRDVLDSAPAMTVEFAVSSNSRASLKRCTDWLTVRDPSGQIRAELEAAGALSDGCVDIGEEAEFMAREMIAHGLRASLVELTDPGTNHESLAAADLARLAEHIVALAGG